jgi:NAD-dependent dihydropyrimidine dehydrogenase PreA subunit
MIMAKRKIININEELCNGCGNCISGCSEGALQLIDGKAKLVKEDFCDGFGDCIGTCPTGALKIEERDAKDFDIDAVKQHLMQTQGKEAVQKMEEAQKVHESKHVNSQGGGGCPGMKEKVLGTAKKVASSSATVEQAIPSELEQWPVQLHLINPNSPMFKNKELVVLSSCSPIASADVHWRYIRGRSIAMGCPKLDRTDPYVPKLAEIMKEQSIPKVIVVVMEVPCCKGLTMMIEEAHKLSGRKDLVIEEHILSLNGKLLNINQLI